MHSFFLVLSLVLPTLVLAVPLESHDNGNAYSGAGGQAGGGSVSGNGGLLNINSSQCYYMRFVLVSDIDDTLR